MPDLLSLSTSWMSLLFFPCVLRISDSFMVGGLYPVKEAHIYTDSVPHMDRVRWQSQWHTLPHRNDL